MDNYICFDVETTISNKGSPYDRSNFVVLWGYHGSNFGSSISTNLEPFTREMGTVVGFNLKFDLTWAKRNGILLDELVIHDCQLAHFLLTGQSSAYPSLDRVSEQLGLGRKLDKVKEYWEAGINTDQIPDEILREYLVQDLLLTEQVYLRQMQAFEKKPQLYKLFQLQCEDLLTLLDMEYNGIVVDVPGCNAKAIECEKQLKQIDADLVEFAGDVPINYNSNDHLSCLIYGGCITHEVKVPVGVYKTGAKVGQVRNKKMEYKFDLPRLATPPKGSELAKEGYYSTDEDTLRNLTGGRKLKRLVELLLARSRLEKLRGTYLVGVPEQLQRSNSFDGRLHGQFNQVVARTGRLSSSSPNLQNFNPEIKQLLPSRFQ